MTTSEPLDLPLDFPADFTWGVSTSAYQIEGAADEDGRGRSIWDTFSRTPGRIVDGGTGDVACDHYHRYTEDADLMAGLGIDAYRFSIAWPRIQPDGTGPANAAGLAFYDRLVDTLLDRGIDPVATLFHWDLPQALEDRGGWLARDTAARFGDYTDLVGAHLGDRVKLWITLNEPFVHMSLGYGMGTHAPGRSLLFDAFPAAHHQLLGHGLAVAALRSRTGSPVTIANNYSPVHAVGAARAALNGADPNRADPNGAGANRADPNGAGANRADPNDADRAAAAAYHALHNRLFTDPLLGRGYPAELGLDDSVVHDGDLAVISAPIDVLGVNYYNPTAVAAPDDPAGPLPFDLVPLTDHPTTSFGWPVVPDGLHQLLTGLRNEYGAALPPIQITESGCCYDDPLAPDGSCDDPDRISYLDGHLRALRRAMDEGVDVRGYFVWSLLDNFEWAEGYTKRFGLVHVDFETQRRTPKSSYAWYRDLIRGRRP